jgi:hypothetical protein
MELVRAVHQPVQNGVGERRVTDIVVPVFDRELAGDQGGASADTVIEEFEQISALARTDIRSWNGGAEAGVKRIPGRRGNENLAIRVPTSG